jgi:collagenase-like PrtC family protease
MIKSQTTQNVRADKITLGPLFFHWTAEKRRDFYFRIADEAAIDCVYLGEVVCSKREIFFSEFLPVVSERLRSAGKEVIVSTLALVTSKREMNTVSSYADAGFMVEANDVASLQALHGKPHVIGPFINVFNESTRDYLVKNNATRIVLPVEMTGNAISMVAGEGKAAEIEVMVFGRQPLSVAMRCYHARAHELNKDSCQFVCSLDQDGLQTNTLDQQPILTVNGTQTMSHGYAVLLHELAALQSMGVSHFRLSPQNVDMTQVAQVYRNVLERKLDPAEALEMLKITAGSVPFINGFWHGSEGFAWVENRA